MLEVEAPEYRVRLFLSVDLTGSTDFKSKNNSTAWLKAFQRFYGEFPKTFISIYEDVCGHIPQMAEIEKANFPKVWKTIGDEIIFVNRVYSLCHVSAYVTAFVETLKRFGQELQLSYNYKLNTKGNAWVAAFPSPNCSIRLSIDGRLDPINGTDELPSEKSECDVDQNPRFFDFLGKGIDGGFRIARNSTINTLTVSPGLAYLLCKARKNVDTTQFIIDLHFAEMQEFKGVANGEPYPIITIDTTRDEKRKNLISQQRKLLKSHSDFDVDGLTAYLGDFLDFYKIEKPLLKIQYNNNTEPFPDHYTEYLHEWNAQKAQLSNIQDMEAASGNADRDGDADIIDVNEERTAEDVMMSITDALI
ncbi:hypothetical protein [Phyllobacterium leguminum]|uniref:Uncharacterized protein n=1 Tax=Phyllobacterium leguminum TaxID=314237 RepID=A0A318T2D5_9HYPH|nr:hypothetical protein [Phyllobacterium leguminum]PYE88062.1 hypothetical protein C7477_109107 [Phyllobacterium leguminum]